ncbi:FecR family protein [Mucilaginibacter sp. X4EP1]|uniref:FecR family protein n=1 Tax=Mucilaginibacter sp. X4EP1 TaxID=2723092 RepID=UPI0021679F83|nr:FecR family protein [Mucilaginibacter sp. X4EP1]MCS3812845.1 ferric-dicitrate binding protein FerR (iron transport regulator) [Mucilaginibacter sp. X4EP1]
MKQKGIKKLLNKFNAGKCSPEELEMLKTLMQELEQDNGIPIQTQRLKEQIWERIEIDLNGYKKPRRLNTTWLKVAAVLLITTAAGIFFSRLLKKSNSDALQVAYQTITAPRGEMQEIVLPDSTVVHLNAASTIKFPVAFDGKKRELFLLEGEAYFEVRHNAKRPFLVHTGNVTTQVLGTSFNIKFYKDLPDLQVFVNSGKVEVHDQTHTLGMYTPQQLLTYNKLKESFVRGNTSDDHLLSWMHSDLILDNVSFAEIAVYLENRYNVNFKYTGKKGVQQRYSVRFSNKLTIRQVVDILQLIDGRKYQLKGNNLTIK